MTRPAPARAPWIRLQTGYHLDAIATALLPGHAIALGVRARLPLARLGAGLSYRVTFERSHSPQPGITLLSRRHPLELELFWRLGDGRLGGALGMTAGLDLATWGIQRGNRSVEFTDKAVLTFGPLARMGWRINRWLTLEAAAGARIPTTGQQYTVKLAGQSVVLAETWRIQPWLQVGAAVGVF